VSGRILIADDSANIREVLQMSLETLGYEVLLAEDGDQALQRIYRDSPDLLILDVMMPKQNGFQICRKVKADPERMGTPVILLTAKSQREDVYWGKDCGADEYMTKPFSAKELEGAVERLLLRRAAERSGVLLDFEDDLARRRATGEEGALCLLQWDPRAMDVFRKKYGEVRYDEALERLRREGESFLRSESEGGRLTFVDGNGFRLLISGDPEEVEELAEELCKRLTRLARGFYDPTDRERKTITIRDFKTGETQSVPLLSFTAEVDPFGR
jgi:DNA-binding response OmpR family regulator